MTEHTRRWLILGVVAGCYFPVAADATILNLAIPSLNNALGTSAQDILWIANIYPLLMVGLVLVTGPLGDRIGHQRLLLWGLVVFAAASAGCAFASTPAALIAGRGALAVGASAIIPATLSIIRQVFVNARERAFAIGVWSAVASGGAALGPPLGGILLEYFWWGSVFLINIPIALVALLGVGRLLGNHPATQPSKWEALSPALGVAGIVCVVYAIQAAGHAGSSLASIVVPATIGVGVLTVFTRRQLWMADPMLDLRLFQGATFRFGVLLAVVPVMIMVGFELLLAQELQFAVGLTPLSAAMVLLPMPLAAFVAGPSGGYLVARFGMRLVVPVALGTAALGYFGLYVGSSRVEWLVPCLLLIGTGHGAVMTTASDAIMTSAPADRAGNAASVESVSYELGAGLGIAVLGSLMAWLYTARFPQPLGGQVPESASHSIGEAMRVAEDATGGTAELIVTAARTAYTDGFRVVMLVAGVVLVALALIASRSPRPQS